MLDFLPNPLSHRRQDKIIATKGIDRHCRSEDWVLCASKDRDWLGPERLPREAVWQHRLVEPPNDQVDFARCKEWQQVLSAALLKLHLDFGITGLEPGQCARKNTRSCHRKSAERD